MATDFKNNAQIKNIVFDFGGVLVDWNPRYLYREYFNNEDEMEYFLKYICNNDWDSEQDKGRSISEGTLLLQNKFPEYHYLIGLFYEKWEVMLKEEIVGSIRLLDKLKESYSLFGLTNWSLETIPIAFKRYNFFHKFDGIIISGEEKLIKPDPRIYRILLSKYNIESKESIFIDDNMDNVKTANDLGFISIHFTNSLDLEKKLKFLQVL